METAHGSNVQPAAIDGRTEFVWIVGSPVEQVKAPQIMNPHYAAGGDNVRVIPAAIDGSSLRQVFDAAKHIGNVRGWIVTVPHKMALAAWVDDLSPSARIAGAVNAIRFRDGRSYGELFDGQGFVRGVGARGFAVAGLSVLVLGAGGVGSAIALALAEAGASRIGLFDIDAERAKGLAARLAEFGPASTQYEATAMSAAGECDLVINASPVGMAGDLRSPLAPGLLRRSHVVAEVVMTPELTPLLLEAQRVGCDIHPGKQMLDGQLRMLLEFFR